MEYVSEYLSIQKTLNQTAVNLFDDLIKELSLSLLPQNYKYIRVNQIEEFM